MVGIILQTKFNHTGVDMAKKKEHNLRSTPINLAKDVWCYEEEGGIEIYGDQSVFGRGYLCTIPLRTIKAYLKRRITEEK